MSKKGVKLSDKDKKVSLKLFICNWPKCKMGNNGKPAPSERLCPYCHKVGYCCVHCLEVDIDRHILKECQQNIKKAKSSSRKSKSRKSKRKSNSRKSRKK